MRFDAVIILILEAFNSTFRDEGKHSLLYTRDEQIQGKSVRLISDLYKILVTRNILWDIDSHGGQVYGFDPPPKPKPLSPRTFSVPLVSFKLMPPLPFDVVFASFCCLHIVLCLNIELACLMNSWPFWNALLLETFPSFFFFFSFCQLMFGLITMNSAKYAPSYIPV